MRPGCCVGASRGVQRSARGVGASRGVKTAQKPTKKRKPTRTCGRCGNEDHLRVRVCKRCKLEFYEERPEAMRLRLNPPRGRPPQRTCARCGNTSHIRCHACKHCGEMFPQKIKTNKTGNKTDNKTTNKTGNKITNKTGNNDHLLEQALDESCFSFSADNLCQDDLLLDPLDPLDQALTFFFDEPLDSLDSLETCPSV